MLSRFATGFVSTQFEIPVASDPAVKVIEPRSVWIDDGMPISVEAGGTTAVDVRELHDERKIGTAGRGARVDEMDGVDGMDSMDRVDYMENEHMAATRPAGSTQSTLSIPSTQSIPSMPITPDRPPFARRLSCR